nr:trihelix transcription factor GT-2-like [Ipomoea batatas]
MLDFSGGIVRDGSAEAPESGGEAHFGGEDAAARAEEGGGERNSGGNRWPRQETIALLKIRTEMDAGFRDSSHKAPLWEEVSRKMAELGYRRSSKKCKEKFENVYKYHKRTKDGRAFKSDGKSYRFFDQLEAFGNHSTPPPPPPAVVSAPVPEGGGQVTVSSIPEPFSAPIPANSPPFPPPSQPLLGAAAEKGAGNVFPVGRNNNNSSASLLWCQTSSSSTSSDEDIQRRHGRKRRRKDFFERLMRDVIEKQENMQKKFLETIEKREIERTAREEAWRAQETARINRDHDLLIQERSMAAAKDTAVIKLLQTIAEKNNIQIPAAACGGDFLPPPPPTTVTPPQTAVAPPPTTVAPPRTDNNNSPVHNSRWPKPEIEALIRIRTSMDTKYQENGPKGPLWEEVAAEMQKLGHCRNAKRCKEKWENINKYFKKVKESNKKRPEDSKTCPYFHQLEALYKEKSKIEASMHPLEAENSPIMARPEQQWPPAAVPGHNADHNDDNEEEEEDNSDDDDNDEAGGGYEVLPTPGSGAGAGGAATGTAE